jgi:hypothetical protein
MRSEDIHPRKLGPAALAVDEALRALGITDAVYTKAKHARVEFRVGPATIRMSLPCTPRDNDVAAKRAVTNLRRLIAEACAR